MKTKKLDKKLVLNKKTIADLFDNEMKNVYGGASLDTCWTDCRTLCATEDCCETRLKIC